MSFSSDYEALRKKRLEEELKKTTNKKSSTKKASSNSFSDQYAELREKRTSKKVDIEDIAPASKGMFIDTPSFLERRAAEKANKESKIDIKPAERKRTHSGSGGTADTPSRKVGGGTFGTKTPTEEEKTTFSRIEDEVKSKSGGLYQSMKMQKLDGSPLGAQHLPLAENAAEREAQSKYKEEDKGFFKSGAFKDGYQFGDVTKSVASTVGDIGVNAAKGLGGMAEGVVDLVQYGVAGMADLVGADEFADDLKRVTRKNVVNDFLAPAEKKVNKNSFLGDTSDAVMQGLGQVGGIILSGGAGSAAGLGTTGTSVLTTGTMFASSAGSGMSEAYQSGADDATAVAYGVSKGAIDAGTELIFGGLGKAVNALGFSRGISSLDDIFARKISGKLSNQTLKNISEFGIKASAEGLEEVLAGVGSAAAKKLTGMSDEDLGKLIADENLLEQFVVGAVTSGIAQAPGLVSSSKTGTDFITGLTQDEQTVVDKEVEKRIAEAEKDGEKLSQKDKGKITEQVQKDLDRGYVSIDTIEEILGEDNAYNPAKSSYVKRGRLAESYNERARRGAQFTADVTKYDEKQRETVQRAIDSGILNDTNRTHDFVDLLAKLSADRGVSFDFTNNERIKESGFAVEGKVVNGFVTKDGISLNIDSPRVLEATVGHEITHVLEGTEVYTELQNALFEYAKGKNDYDGRLETLTKLYEGVEGADINKEMTADLVGEYIFNDADFIGNLSTNHRNVFQKIYDEIKHLLKLATAGSKEARQLERAKHTFDKAWKETKGTQAKTETRYSISETSDGRIAAVIDNDILSNIDTSSWDKTKKDTAKKAASKALNQFKDGIVVDGITRKVNKTSRNEYTRSRYTESLYKYNTDVFADKMRAADVADDIVVATTNWNRDGGLTHSRDDNFVDFDHGTTLIVSGDRKYSAEVVVGITDSGEAVLYDVVNMTPAEFEIKKAESSTAATTQKAIGDILEDSATDSIPQKEDTVNRQYSLSVESDGGKNRTHGQQSLSYEDEAPLPFGTPARDLMYQPPVSEDAHPIRNDVDPTPMQAEAVADNITPPMPEERMDMRFLQGDDYVNPLDGRDIAPPGLNEDSKEYISMEEFASSDSSVWKNVAYDDDETKANIMRDTHDRMVADGAVVAVSEEVRNTVDAAYPDLRGMKKKERTPILKEAMQKLKANLRQFLSGFKDKNFEFDIDGKLLEAKLYNTGINEVLEKITKEKAGMLYSTESIFKNARYMYSSPDYDGDPNVYRWNYFYTPVQIGEETVGVRIAVRDVKEGQNHLPESQVYNWGIKKDTPLGGVQPVVSDSSHGASSDVSMDSISDIVPPVKRENVMLTGDDIAPPTIKKQADVYDVDFAPISEADAITRQRENLASISDEDAPPEVDIPYTNIQDSISIDKKSLKQISKTVSETLALNKRGRKDLEEVIQNFSKNETATREELFNELKSRFGTQYDSVLIEGIAEVKKWLRTTGINVTPSVKSEFGSPAEYVKFMRSNMGKLRFSKNGRYVDEVYQEISEVFPALLPSNIENEADELLRMAEVVNEPAEELVPVYLPDSDIQDAADMIYDSMLEYAETERMAMADANSRKLRDLYSRSNAFTPPSEEIAPPTRRERPALDPADYVGEQVSMFPETESDKDIAPDNLKRAYARIDRELKEKKAELEGEFKKRRAELESRLEKGEIEQSELTNLEGEYNRATAQLDMEAEIERDNARKANDIIKRKELHENIINDMKAEFTARGSDLDRVLRRAKNLSTFATVDNTPQRVMQKSLGYKEGGILADLTVNKVAQNETEGIKWLNTFTDRKNGELARISKKYHIKPGSKQSMAVQMYAEGYYVNDEGEHIKYGDNELMADFPNLRVQENIKGLARDPRIRQIYDETLDAINESRVRNGYPAIERLDNYFLHFRAMGDFFSKNGIPFNPNDIKAKDLPTDINGMTADLKPGQPYFASARHREGIRTTFDLLGGLEKYLTSAKNQIYHIDDIQKLRALRNYIADDFGQAKGLESIDSMTEEEAQERIKQVFGSHLSTFARFLNEEANVLAGKTALIDRGLEGIIGRRGITFINDVNKQVGANQVGYNVGSPLTNLLADVQAFAKMNKFDFIKGFAQTVTNRFGSIVGRDDGFGEQSSVMIRRKGADAFHRTTWQKLADPGYALMGATDSISTEIIARAKYNELMRKNKGMTSEQAHYETDKWVSALMGDRSLGQMPHIFNSKMLGLVTKYQLEVRNQLDSMIYDTIQETKASNEEIENKLARNAKTAAKVASTWFGLAVAQNLFGKAFESIAGYNPAFDIIEAISAAFGWDDEEDSEDTALDNIEQGSLTLLEDLPYASVVMDGGRIPISAALPIEQLIKGENEYGQEVPRWKTALEALPYYVMPGGYGQLKKSVAGLKMFDDDLPISGSYTDKGALRFPVEETPLNVAQAGLFGQWASGNARDYFDRGAKPLEGKQINEFIDADMPIQEYWDYREGLSGLKTLEEKADYINSLDIPLWKKNLFINDIADRKEDIDMEDYSEYDSMDEFDFANEYPEKYAFFTENGVSYEDYDSASKETKSAYNWAAKDEDRYAFLVDNGVSLADPSAFDTEEKKSAWTWAYKNPDKYEVAKAVTGDVVAYRGYTSELYDIRADKDENGDSIVGSAKEKKHEYIFSLDLDYGQKCILFKSQYNADDTYNYDIIDYLNERDDISYEQAETILKELGFDVASDGTITWED